MLNFYGSFFTLIAGNTVWSMPERLECEVLRKARYINTLTFTFTFTEHCLHFTDVSRLWRDSRHHWEILDEVDTRHQRLLNINDLVFTQDSAPSHRAKATQQFLQQNTPDFIAADEWALYSPDFNPLGCCIWDILQDLVYEGQQLQFANLQDLKEAIKTTGRKLPWRQFQNPLHSEKKRLNMVRKQNGGTIQHIFCSSLWPDIDHVQRDVLNGLFCAFRSLLRISLLKQKCITSYLFILFSCNSSFFVWILVLNSTSYNIIAKLFFMSHPV